LGDPVEAARSARDYLSGGPWRCDEGLGTAIALEVLAWVADGRQRPRGAAVLLGAARARLAESGIAAGGFAHLARHREACEQRARRALGEVGFQECFSHGHTLSLRDAIGCVEDRRAAPASATTGPVRLTPRERQVADLVAEGRSNKDIAAALVISQRTAETHVENILTKLGCTSRSRIATWAAAEHATQIPRELHV
jgi:DNA-binding NarL/FixJ family response regulator